MPLLVTLALIATETGIAAALFHRWGGPRRAMTWTFAPALLLPLVSVVPPSTSRYAIFAILLTVILLQVLLFARRLDKEVEPREWRVGVLLAMLLAALAVQQVYSPPFDDESMRLMAVISLGSDGDFDLSNQYRSEAWHAFRDRGPAYFVDFADKVRRAIQNDDHPFYPYHSVGFAVVMWPGFALGSLMDPKIARLGAATPVFASAVGLAVLLVRLLCNAGYAPYMARRLTAAFALAAPSLFFGVHLWPEVMAALAGTWIIAVLYYRQNTRLAAAAIGAVLAFLPHLHFRYAFLSMTLAVVVLLRMRPAQWGWIIAGGLLPGLILIANMAIRSDPHTWSVLTHIRYEFPAALGLPDFTGARLMDPQLMLSRIITVPAGFALYIPVLLVTSLRGNSLRWPALLAASGIMATTLTYALSSGPLARYWVPILPLLFLAALPRENVSRIWAALASFGITKGILLCSVPAFCHDALFARRLAETLSFPWNGLVTLLLG